MSDADQLEHQGNETRDRISELLDELRSRLSPGELVDQLIGLAGKDAPAKVVRNLGEQVRSKPLPCLMVGAGIAWLMWSERRPQTTATQPKPAAAAARRAAQGARKMDNEVKSTASGVGAQIASAAEATATTASQAYAQARHTGEHALDQAASTMRHAAQSVRGTSLSRFIEEHPLVVFGAGLALGALLGAAFPATRVENRLLGETADELKDQARDLVAAGQEKAEEIGTSAVRSATEAAEQAVEERLPFGGEHGTAYRDRPVRPKSG